MKKLIALGFFCFSCIYGNQQLESYFSYIKQLNQSNGNYREGEIEIVTDPTEISQIQKIQENRLLKKGFSEEKAREFSRIGVVNEDQYWIWLRDAVYFPQGVPGTYDRLVWKNELQEKLAGVAVLPVLPSNRIVLILNYRHATRSWELELPRGRVDSKESLEAAAFRELKEETGLIASSMSFLGEMTPDTGVLSSVIPVFLGKISGQEASSIEYSEAIADVISFTKEELKKGLIKGFLEVTIQGAKKQIPIRDPFLTFALFQAESRELF